MHRGDDEITIEYCWPQDFKEGLDRGYVSSLWVEHRFIDHFKFTIKTVGFTLKHCSIHAANQSATQIDDYTWELNMEKVLEWTPIHYRMSH